MVVVVRGTLEIDRDAPAGFGTIRLVFELEHDAGEERPTTLLRLTEHYRVVDQTLAGGVPPSVSLAGATR